MKRCFGNVASAESAEKAWLHFVTEGFGIAANRDESLGCIAADIDNAGVRNNKLSLLPGRVQLHRLRCHSLAPPRQRKFR